MRSDPRSLTGYLTVTRTGQSPPLRRVLSAAAIGLGFGLVLALVLGMIIVGYAGPGDGVTYLAAGERLAHGGDLYALAAGDRLVSIEPPYWDVPLLYPPLIAVLWAPISAAPAGLGLYAWQVVCAAAVVGVIVSISRRAPIATGLATAFLALPITYGLVVGNVDALLLAVFVGAWLAARSGHPTLAGVALGVIGVLKVTPLAVVVWIVAIAPRRGGAGVAIGVAAALTIGVVAAGIDAHLQFIGIALRTVSDGTSALSLAGAARALGVSSEVARLIPPAFAALGLVCVVLLRQRPGISFALAILVVVFGSPVVNLVTPMLLLAALAPVAWPWRVDAAQEADEAAPVTVPLAGPLPSGSRPTTS